MLADAVELRQTVERVYGLQPSAERPARSVASHAEALATAQGVRQPGGAHGEAPQGNGGGGELKAAAPVVELVQNLVAQAVHQRASDIHCEPWEDAFTVRFRVDGTLRTAIRLSKILHPAVISRIKVMAGMDISEQRVPQDGRFRIDVDGQRYDCRCSSMPTVHGEKMVIRLLAKDSQTVSLPRLGLEPGTIATMQQWIHSPYGMILISGPTGSGKSTTLAALLQELPREVLNVVTVEDPVEYEIEGVNHSQVNNRAGLTFDLALRHFLRQDPDVIMVGEIRDHETAETAVRAALTGHLLLSTVHTNDAPGTVTRLIDMGVEPFLLSASLLGVAAQRLVRTLCRVCRHPVPLTEAHRALFATAGVDLPERLQLFEAQGCSECRDGYVGRKAIAELMPVTNRLRELIQQRVPDAAIRAMALEEGMISLRRGALGLAARGEISVEEALRVTREDDDA